MTEQSTETPKTTETPEVEQEILGFVLKDVNAAGLLYDVLDNLMFKAEQHAHASVVSAVKRQLVLNMQAFVDNQNKPQEPEETSG